jgi:hypothetical protein
MGGIISLINLIRREVRGIDIRRELRLKWRTNTTKGIKLNTTEEFVILDLICTSTAKSILSVTDKTR